MMLHSRFAKGDVEAAIQDIDQIFQVRFQLFIYIQKQPD